MPGIFVGAADFLGVADIWLWPLKCWAGIGIGGIILEAAPVWT